MSKSDILSDLILVIKNIMFSQSIQKKFSGKATETLKISKTFSGNWIYF